MRINHMQKMNNNDKIIIHALLYTSEDGTWHSPKQILKLQWEK